MDGLDGNTRVAMLMRDLVQIQLNLPEVRVIPEFEIAEVGQVVQDVLEVAIRKPREGLLSNRRAFRLHDFSGKAEVVQDLSYRLFKLKAEVTSRRQGKHDRQVCRLVQSDHQVALPALRAVRAKLEDVRGPGAEDGTVHGGLHNVFRRAAALSQAAP
jgi:hypothetical protein